MGYVDDDKFFLEHGTLKINKIMFTTPGRFFLDLPTRWNNQEKKSIVATENTLCKYINHTCYWNLLIWKSDNLIPEWQWS